MKTQFIICSEYLAYTQHLREISIELSQTHRIIICTNLSDAKQYNSYTSQHPNIQFRHIPFSRSLALLPFAISCLTLFNLLLKYRPYSVVSFTPPCQPVSTLAIGLYRLTTRSHPKYVHYFTGLIWPYLSLLNPLRYVLLSVDLLTLLSTSFVLFDGVHQKDLYLKHFPSLKRKLRIVRFGSLKGVDLALFKPSMSSSLRKACNIPADSFNFLYIGRINKSKGISQLLESFLLLYKSNPNIWLTLVGPIEDPTFSYLKDNTHPSITYLPYTETPHLIYPLADILVLPSFREGFGSVIIEAAACSIPAIGSFIPALNENIVHLHTGMLFTHQYPSSLYCSMNYAASNPAIVRQFGENALSQVVAKYSQVDVLQSLRNELQ